MFLLSYYRFQITEVTFLSETFTYDMRERAKRASAQNHRVFSFLRNNEGLRMSQVMYALSANIHYSSRNKDITASRC